MVVAGYGSSFQAGASVPAALIDGEQGAATATSRQPDRDRRSEVTVAWSTRRPTGLACSPPLLS